MYSGAFFYPKNETYNSQLLDLRLEETLVWTTLAQSDLRRCVAMVGFRNLSTSSEFTRRTPELLGQSSAKNARFTLPYRLYTVPCHVRIAGRPLCPTSQHLEGFWPRQNVTILSVTGRILALISFMPGHRSHSLVDS
jgi:hypothetical protein